VEAVEEVRDLFVEAALRDQISGRVDALKAEHDRCHADHENRLSGLQTSHDSHKSLIDQLQAQVADLATRIPIVAPLSTLPASAPSAAETEAEASPVGAVIVPAAAQAAEAVPVALATGRKRRGTFL
jgi:predicted metal-dependent hydrolase